MCDVCVRSHTCIVAVWKTHERTSEGGRVREAMKRMYKIVEEPSGRDQTKLEIAALSFMTKSISSDTSTLPRAVLVVLLLSGSYAVGHSSTVPPPTLNHVQAWIL